MAQQILHEYQENRSKIQKARIEYLNSDNLLSKRKVQENNEKHEQQQRVRFGQEEQKRMLKEMAQKFENYEKRKTNKEKASGETSRSRLYSESNEEVRKHKSPDMVSKNNLPTQKKKSTNVIDVTSSKRFHHPSSKLIINSEDRQKDFLGLIPMIADQKMNKRANEDPRQYSLQIHSSPNLKKPQLFSRYYSGGPPEYEDKSTNVRVSLITCS